MYLYLFIALLVLCFYQDVRFRGLHWILFPLLCVGAVLVNPEWVWKEMMYSLIFLIATMVALTAYLSLKEGRFVQITNGYFSLGDILFLLAIIPLFDFREYLLFFTLGTCMTLVMHMIVSMIRRQKTVPYAGYMAAVGIAFLLFQEQIQSYLGA